jgi:IS5 family transposase
MDRNHLKGKLGDELNVIFAAAGFNLRKLLKAYALFLYLFYKTAFWRLVYQLRKCYTNRSGKGRAREGNNLSSKGFSISQTTFA